MDTALTVLSHLVFDEIYARKILPYIKSDYFDRRHFGVVFELLAAFVTKYNAFPSREALLIELKDVSDKLVSDNLIKDARDLILEIKKEDDTNQQWLIDKTEAWCKERAMENALTVAIEIMDGKHKTLTKGAIPQLMTEALAVSFDTHIGHDYLGDAEARWEFYHTKEKKIPFSLSLLNEITDGGVSAGTLNVFMAVTGGGKSRFMCNEAAYQLQQGYNVLYITLEMSEMEIARRKDANLLDIPIKDLKTYPQGMYHNRVNSLRRKTTGRLIIKEFPTASAGVNHFRYALQELKLKQNFTPDVIYIDYINICMSSRMKMGNSSSYEYIKAIAEELRGLGGEYKVPIISATQINRDGFKTSEIEMEHVSRSIGLPATCDLLMAISPPKDMETEPQLQFKQLKNRYGDPTRYPKFFVGLDPQKMRLFDLDNSQEGLHGPQKDDPPIMDRTEFGVLDAKERMRLKFKEEFK